MKLTDSDFSLTLFDAGGLGPEDPLIGADGWCYSGLGNGDLIRINSETGNVETLARTGGRPLGLDWLDDGRMVVADAILGLCAFDIQTRAFDCLIPQTRGQFVNNPHVSGTCVYFSTSSDRYPVQKSTTDVIENVPTGKLWRYDLEKQELDCLLDGLAFANGVVISPDGTFALVAETARARIHRYWLKGGQAGRNEIFAEVSSLPDNMSIGTDGNIWIALVTPYSGLLKAVHRLPLLLRRVVAKMVELVPPKDPKTAHIQVMNWAGETLKEIVLTNGDFHHVTGIREMNGDIWMGSISESRLAQLRFLDN